MTRNPDADDRRQSEGRQLIMGAKAEAFEARRTVRRELPDPSQGSREDLAAAIGDYYDLLSDYRDEGALDESFDERFSLNIDKLLKDTMVIEQSISSRNPHAVEEVEVPRVLDLTPTQLIGIAKELDDIAKELGFAAPARDPTPGTEATHDDVRQLLRSRGQTEALDHLPDFDDE